MLVTCSGTDIELNIKQVYYYLGCGASYKPPACISSLIGERVEQTHHLIKPAYSHTFKNIED